MEKSIPTVNIHEAKTQLSKLVDRAAKGDPFIIAKAGKPLVKVTALDAPTPKKVQRLGFLEGQAVVPDDFDEMYREEIEQMFYGDERNSCLTPTCPFGPRSNLAGSPKPLER